jgi:hypothetical protein
MKTHPQDLLRVFYVLQILDLSIIKVVIILNGLGSHIPHIAAFIRMSGEFYKIQ